VGSRANSKFRYGFTDFYKGQAVAVWQEDKDSGEMPYAQNINCDGETGPQESELAGNIVKASSNSVSIKNIYPNPVQNNLTVTIISSVQSNIRIYITDVSGNVLKQFQQNLQERNNLIQLNVNNIKPGSYFIKVMNKSSNASTLFYKQ